MSLIPYHPREGREIVLRHHNAIVVRDPSSQRLEIRGLNECPTCHQPLRATSPDRPFDLPLHHDSYVDPDYFRMLRTGNDHAHHNDRPPSSPIRRLVEPVPRHDPYVEELEDAEFVSSTPAVKEGGRIRREAFSPNYFTTFFVEERELGRGGKGVVLLVRHEIDGCHLGHFACKRVPVGDDHAWLERVLIEVELLAKLSHPNLVSYRHVWLEDVKLSRFAPSVACAFILQQYCNSGDLLHYVVGDQPKEATKEELKAQMRRKSKGQGDRPQDLFAPLRRLQFEEIYSLFKDITSGLAYLHAANYIHRDLKPSNCLLHREGKSIICLISDFGEVQPENVVRKSTGSTGTISYCAPEVLQKDSMGHYGNFTTKSDIFSLGMILYFMCFGHLPYQSANTVQEELEDIDLLRAEITDWKGFQDERRERPDLPSKLYQLLKKMLSLNPAERPSANEVLSAMKSESSLDGVTRGPRSSSPSIGLPGRRIQSLDSPLPPSTPVPDPQKHANVPPPPQDDFSSPIIDDRSPQPTTENTIQKHHSDPDNNQPRHRTHAMTLSRSQDGFPRPFPDLTLTSNHDPHHDHNHDHDHDHTSSRQPSPTITTPLLMPPPPQTFIGTVRHRVLVARHSAAQLLSRESETPAAVVFSVRISLFLVKMATLARACWPYSAGFGVGAYLVGMAAVDLSLPGRVTRFGYGNGSTGQFGIRGAPSGGHQHELEGPWRWVWDWRFSALLLVLHFVVLGVTSRIGALCAASDEKWMVW